MRDVFEQMGGGSEPELRDVHVDFPVSRAQIDTGAEVRANLPDGRSVMVCVPPEVTDATKLCLANAAPGGAGDVYLHVRIVEGRVKEEVVPQFANRTPDDVRRDHRGGGTGMFDRWQRSWDLVKEAWAVLREDRSLVLFPILAGVCSLVVTMGFVIPIAIAIWAMTNGTAPVARPTGHQHFHLEALHYVGMFLYYLITYFVIVFFNTGLVACVRARFAGHSPTFRDGIRYACDNVGRIFLWALFSATVGTILKSIQERAGWIGQIVVNLVGIAWTLATTFVVPVLVYEQVGPIEAVKRSIAAFRKTWGETVVANFGMSLAFGGLAAIGIVPMIAGIVIGLMLVGSSPAFGAVLMIGTLLLCVVYWIGLAIVQSALQGIFLTACYEYATTGVVPSVFTPNYVMGAWRPK